MHLRSLLHVGGLNQKVPERELDRPQNALPTLHAQKSRRRVREAAWREEERRGRRVERVMSVRVTKKW